MTLTATRSLTEVVTRQVLPAILFVLCSCAAPKFTSRDNFDDLLHRLVGRDLRKLETVSYGLAFKGSIIDSRSLPNGNIENIYRLNYQSGQPRKYCVYGLEFNPNDKIVLRTEIISGEDACVIPT